MIKQAAVFKQLLGKYLEIDDWEAVDIVLALAIAHKERGEPMWTRLIGQSGSGKTEVLRALMSHTEYCAKVETLTPASIRRGYIPKDKKDTPTLLQRLNGKLAITKETAGLLTANREAKEEVFGLLRSVYDGEMTSDYGSDQGHIEQHSVFDWILAATSFIERQNQLEAWLGTRFMDIRWGLPLDRHAMLLKADDNNGVMPEIRRQLGDKMIAFLDEVSIVSGDTNREMRVALAEILAKLRTPIRRDGRSKIVEETGESESGTRIIQYLGRLGTGLLSIGVSDIKPYLLRMVWGSIPKVRAACLRGMIDGVSQQEMALRAQVSPAWISHSLEDLELVGYTKDMLDILKG